MSGEFSSKDFHLKLTILRVLDNWTFSSRYSVYLSEKKHRTFVFYWSKIFNLRLHFYYIHLKLLYIDRTQAHARATEL